MAFLGLNRDECLRRIIGVQSLYSWRGDQKGLVQVFSEIKASIYDAVLKLNKFGVSYKEWTDYVILVRRAEPFEKDTFFFEFLERA